MELVQAAVLELATFINQSAALKQQLMVLQGESVKAPRAIVMTKLATEAEKVTSIDSAF